MSLRGDRVSNDYLSCLCCLQENSEVVVTRRLPKIMGYQSSLVPKFSSLKFAAASPTRINEHRANSSPAISELLHSSAYLSRKTEATYVQWNGDDSVKKETSGRDILAFAGKLDCGA